MARTAFCVGAPFPPRDLSVARMLRPNLGMPLVLLLLLSVPLLVLVHPVLLLPSTVCEYGRPVDNHETQTIHTHTHTHTDEHTLDSERMNV